MPPHPRIPEELRHGPFLRAQAHAVGVTDRMLNGSSYRRLFHAVWVLRAYVMTDVDWIRAASLAMPNRARMSHLTRIQALGLGFGPLRPFHFTVAGDLHLDVPGIFLHRTEVLPPADDVGVTPAAAFIGFCATARMIDAIKVGDWLLHGDHMSTIEVADLAYRDRWRPGARQVMRVLPHLNGRSRSLKESETRAILEFAGLPAPEVNYDIVEDGIFLACGDLVYLTWKLVVEYEGRQHAEDTSQFNSDISRYKRLRGRQWDYEQITQELLRQPRTMVVHVYQKLVDRGYDGPAPVFGDHWRSLFEPIRVTPHGRRWVSHLSTASMGT